VSKVRVYNVDPKERYQLVGELLDIITNLKTKRDTVDFMIGLLTSSETLMIARRIQIAKSILNGQTYDDIRKKLGVSYQTITKTEKWLRRGDRARQKVLERYILGRESKSLQKSKNYYNRNFLDRYAHHRVLKELLEELIG
jgi:uncharacterized protein YerC